MSELAQLDPIASTSTKPCSLAESDHMAAGGERNEEISEVFHTKDPLSQYLEEVLGEPFPPPRKSALNRRTSRQKRRMQHYLFIQYIFDLQKQVFRCAREVFSLFWWIFTELPRLPLRDAETAEYSAIFPKNIAVNHVFDIAGVCIIILCDTLRVTALLLAILASFRAESGTEGKRFSPFLLLVVFFAFTTFLFAVSKFLAKLRQNARYSAELSSLECRSAVVVAKNRVSDAFGLVQTMFALRNGFSLEDTKTSLKGAKAATFDAIRRTFPQIGSIIRWKGDQTGGKLLRNRLKTTLLSLLHLLREKRGEMDENRSDILFLRSLFILTNRKLDQLSWRNDVFRGKNTREILERAKERRKLALQLQRITDDLVLDEKGLFKPEIPSNSSQITQMSMWRERSHRIMEKIASFRVISSLLCSQGSILWENCEEKGNDSDNSRKQQFIKDLGDLEVKIESFLKTIREFQSEIENESPFPSSSPLLDQNFNETPKKLVVSSTEHEEDDDDCHVCVYLAEGEETINEEEELERTREGSEDVLHELFKTLQNRQESNENIEYKHGNSTESEAEKQDRVSFTQRSKTEKFNVENSSQNLFSELEKVVQHRKNRYPERLTTAFHRKKK